MLDETFDLTLEALADARDLARHAARACSSPRVLLLIRFKFTAVECRLLIRRLLLEVRVNENYYICSNSRTVTGGATAGMSRRSHRAASACL